MMTPDELVSYMDQVAEQLPEESLSGDVYTMVMFAIWLDMADSWEKIAKSLGDIAAVIVSADRRGVWKR